MATVRPIPESYYYSGQGRLGIGDRDPVTGEYSNLVFPGNVTSLTVDIATTKFEHKESMSGQRAVDKTIIQEKNATFKIAIESLSLAVLQLGLFGLSGQKPTGTVTAETHKATLGAAIPLRFPNVSNVVVTKSSGGGTAIAAQSYAVDEGFGTVYINAAASDVQAGDVLSFSYSYGAHETLEAFTQATPPERYLRFEGLNTVDGSLRLLEIPRAAFDPITGLEYINTEFGTGELNGSILPDLTVTDGTKSQYFRERRVAAPV